MLLSDKYDGFIFDLDGTIYRGNDLIPNAEHTINGLKEKGKKVIFISNKTTGSVADYCRLLTKLGINTILDEIVTASITIKRYLTDNHQGEHFYAIGEEIFISEIEAGGLKFSEDPGKVSLVLITLDRQLSELKIQKAARALENGARFFAANIDMTCPVEGGEIPDAGYTIGELGRLTGRMLEKHFGKPSFYMMDEVTKRMNISSDKCLLVGDRLETDIAMANHYGIDSALVSTGIRYNSFQGDIKPTYHLNSVYDIITRHEY